LAQGYSQLGNIPLSVIKLRDFKGIISPTLANSLFHPNLDNMYVFGSANLSETFINDNLFDEYRIGIASVILGSGRPLFRQGIASQNLSLVSTQQLLKGGVILKYTK
jgi:Dihydrofolate reductase